ncbi:MAG: hypothetical protein U0168_03910 [Nannocystaceae bacterium]
MDVYLDEGIRMCRGQLDAYDTFVRNAFAPYAMTAPGGSRFAVHVLAEQDCSASLNCANSSGARITTDLGQYHELMHGIQWTVDGRSIASLEEGTAEAFGPFAPTALSADALADTDREEVIANDARNLDYSAAAVFARFLIDRHGLSSFRSFYRSARQSDSTENYAQVFAESFDETLDASWSVFVSSSRCAFDLWYCQLGDMVQLPLEVSGMDCEDTSTFGFDAGMLERETEPLRRVHTFSVDSGDGQMVTIGLQNVDIYLGSCGSCEYFPEGALLSSGKANGQPPLSVDVTLPPGITAFVVRARPGGDPYVHIAPKG